MNQIHSISFIGSGNVATHLAIALKNAGFEIHEIYSRTFENAKKLAGKVNAKAIHTIDEMDTSADLYILSIPDGAIEDFIEGFPIIKGIMVHTSGITPMKALDKMQHYGVFYPLQTFSRQRGVDLSDVPFCIEASSGDIIVQLKSVAQKLSGSVYEIHSEQRKYLHLTAVLVNNYTNYLYQMAFDILKAKNIDEQLLIPLIEETVSKIKSLHPSMAQTGPARRNDLKTIEKHNRLLDEFPDYKELYKIFAGQLIKKYNEQL